MDGFKSIHPEEINDNLFHLIAKDWTLICAGDESSYNMMTANWAGMGFLWRKNVCFIFIRHGRYTYDFIEKNKSLTLSFFSEEYRDVLNVCGKKSGRDIDKMKDVPLTPVPVNGGAVGFSEARLVLNCEKLCSGEIKDFDFIDKSILDNYADGDYHKLYICEIKEVFSK